MSVAIEGEKDARSSDLCRTEPRIGTISQQRALDNFPVMATVIGDGNLIGAIMASVASIISNLGANAQKRSHDVNAEKPEGEQVAYICRPFWWCGMSGVVGGTKKPHAIPLRRTYRVP